MFSKYQICPAAHYKAKVKSLLILVLQHRYSGIGGMWTFEPFSITQLMWSNYGLKWRGLKIRWSSDSPKYNAMCSTSYNNRSVELAFRNSRLLSLIALIELYIRLRINNTGANSMRWPSAIVSNAYIRVSQNNKNGRCSPNANKLQLTQIRTYKGKFFCGPVKE